MQPVTAAKIKYGIWGLIIGAIIATIVGFAWGGWTTMGTAQTMSDEAVLASQAAICVAQFMKQPNAQEQLTSIKGQLFRTSAVTFIEKGGWDKMPGQAEASGTVARACAKGLELLAEK